METLCCHFDTDTEFVSCCIQLYTPSYGVIETMRHSQAAAELHVILFIQQCPVSHVSLPS